MKRNILIFIDYYLPGEKSGGPIWTIDNLIRSLAADVNISVITRNHDIGSNAPYNIPAGEWINKENHKIYYIDSTQSHLKQVASILSTESYDSIYLNSVFSFKYSILINLLCKYRYSFKNVLIAARGELNPSALKGKWLRKKLYLFASSIFKLYKDVTWQASNDAEKMDILASLTAKSSQVRVVGDLVQLQTSPSSIAGDGERLRIVYISRISRMKNLTLAIKALKGIDEKVIFDIYGPYTTKEDAEYFHQCMREVKGFPSNVECSYCGVLNHTDVQKTLSEYDLFLLPTLGENFGHAIFEALMAGLPVIIGKNTLWSKSLSGKVGWVADTEIEIQTSIRAYIKMNISERKVMSEKARDFATEYVENQNKTAAKEMLQLLMTC